MQALTIGALAREALQGLQTAEVAGSTSTGLFLRLPNAWVIFLSSLGPPGPLTIQLPKALESKYASGVQILVKPDGLYFPPPRAKVDLRIAEIWRAPMAHHSPQGVLPPAERSARLVDMSRLATDHQPGAGWSALLPGLGARLEALAGLPPIVRPALERLRAALGQGEVDSAALALEGLLGLGGGLTPSGDDLALGLLLALSRWGQQLSPQLDRDGFTERVVSLARQSTSDLSASLIEAAAQEQADPRLIAALDGLITGWPPVEKCAAGLAAWGHSSGLDALLGMSLVV